MKTGKLEIIAPDPRTHRAAIVDLGSKVFSTPNYYERYRKWSKYYFGSNYDWPASRIGLVNGEIVTHVGVWGFQMRIGSAQVKTSGVGAVATSGFFRKHGFMKETFAACKDGMRACGYDLSLLFGIRDFYFRFGYQFAWPTSVRIVRAADLPQEKPAHAPRQFQVKHRDDIAAIYNREWAGVTGSAVRPTFVESYYSFAWQGVLWRDGRGRTAGYLIYKQNARQLEIANFGGESEEVLRMVRLLAQRWGVDEIRFITLPYRSAMAGRLRRMNSKVETSFDASGGPLVATVNLAGALEKISPVLARRLALSPWAGWRGDLYINDARECVRLHIARGKVLATAEPRSAHAKHQLQGHDHLASLLVGADEPRETIRVGQMKLKGDAAKLVPVLFPHEHPMMSFCDQM